MIDEFPSYDCGLWQLSHPTRFYCDICQINVGMAQGAALEKSLQLSLQSGRDIFLVPVLEMTENANRCSVCNHRNHRVHQVHSNFYQWHPWCGWVHMFNDKHRNCKKPMTDYAEIKTFMLWAVCNIGQCRTCVKFLQYWKCIFGFSEILQSRKSAR